MCAFKPMVLASEDAYPFNGFDSVLEIPRGDRPTQNAWLTLQLRVRLNFIDSKNPSPKVVKKGALTFIADSDGYLFPILDWPPHLKERFQREFLETAQKTWNFQFLLITPPTCADLDYNVGVDWIVRPNVLCLFRLSLIGASGPLDNSPAAGPLAKGAPHLTINVANLAVPVGSGVQDPDKPINTSIPLTSGGYRADAANYSDQSMFTPTWYDPAQKVLHNTIGHEIGHALGQSHILGLKGLDAYKIGGALGNTKPAYGAPGSVDAWNVMGSGDRVTLLNAVSWRRRIAMHTATAENDWIVTGMMDTLPRKIPAAIGLVGAAPAF